MKVTEIESRVAEIAGAIGDVEKAHALEVQLHLDVLKAIANGSRNAKGMAQAALESSKIKFARPCA